MTTLATKTQCDIHGTEYARRCLHISACQGREAEDVVCVVLHHAGSTSNQGHVKTTPVGFIPTRGDPIGLAGRRLNYSAKVSVRASQVMHSLWPWLR